MALAALIYLILNLFFGQGSEHPIYWLAYSSNADDLMASLSCISTLAAWGIFTVFAVLSYGFRQLKPYARVGAKAVGITLVALVFMFATYYTRFFQSGPFAYGKTMDSVTLNSRTYHLLLYARDRTESWSWYYHLYECDSLDLFCSALTSLPQSTGGISPDVRTIQLVADPASNVISIEVNGANTFTYHPS